MRKVKKKLQLKTEKDNNHSTKLKFLKSIDVFFYKLEYNVMKQIKKNELFTFAVLKEWVVHDCGVQLVLHVVVHL